MREIWLTSFILAGTRVMCDSNRVKGTVKQYLVTNNNDLVINDLGTVSIYFLHILNKALRQILKLKFLKEKDFTDFLNQ